MGTFRFFSPPDITETGRDIKDNPMIPHTISPKVFWNIRVVHDQDQISRFRGDVRYGQGGIDILSVAGLLGGDLPSVFKC